MCDVFDSDLKVDLLQIASQLTQRGDPLAASSRIAQQFTTVTLRLKKLADGIEANPKISTNICLLCHRDLAAPAAQPRAAACSFPRDAAGHEFIRGKPEAALRRWSGALTAHVQLK